MRIVYYTPPSTPGAYFRIALKVTFLAYLGTAVIFFLTTFINSSSLEGEGGILSFFYNIFSPITSPIFAWAGLKGLSVGKAGLYTLFLMMFTPALFNAIPMTRLKMEQLTLLDEAYGPVRRPEHWRWFLAAFGLFLGVFTTRFIENNATEHLVRVAVDCTKLVMLCACVVASICFVFVGWRLRSSWLKSPNAVTLPGKPAAKKKPKHLHVAIDNSKPVKAAPSGVADTTDNGLYVALTAELIQIIGRTKALPSAITLTETMTMLQKAAQMTRSGQFSHPDLTSLCERTCALFAEGKLQHMPDLKAALAIYKKPDPARLMDIAAELKKQLELQ